MNDLARYRHVHFVGIGGIGMSALARLLLNTGYRVSGSDLAPGEQGEALRRLGARVYEGHQPENLDGADLVVISSAVKADNAEVRRARERGVPVVKRAELLGAIMNAGRGIAVAGTHGKTTTSALIAHILTSAGLDPTVLIGGISANSGSNSRVGGSGLVVVEADEYDASFLQLRPDIAVILNIEPEHLDFYGNFEHLQAAFRQFASVVAGALIVCADDPASGAVLESGAAEVITYGIHSGEWRAGDIRERDGKCCFTVRHDSETHPFVTLLAGNHNVRNALAAIIVGNRLGLPFPALSGALASFRGVQRRFERKGEAGDVLVMDDYAHHPTEIRVNLTTMRERFGRPIRVIFQPHTYSRTAALLDEFSDAFEDADTVYLLDIYPARETDSLGISGNDLATAVARRHQHVLYTETRNETVAAVVAEARPGDLVVTMGAGDVYQLGPMVLTGLERK